MVNPRDTAGNAEEEEEEEEEEKEEELMMLPRVKTGNCTDRQTDGEI